MANKRKKAPGGSRPLPPGKKKLSGMSFKLSTAERSVIDQAAEMDHQKPAPWTRWIAVTAAEYRIQGIALAAAFEAAMLARGQSRR